MLTRMGKQGPQKISACRSRRAAFIASTIKMVLFKLLLPSFGRVLKKETSWHFPQSGRSKLYNTAIKK